MFKRLFLSVAKQAVDECLAPRSDALRDELKAELGGRIDALETKMDARFTEVEKRLDAIDEKSTAHPDRLSRLDQRVIDLKETLNVEHRLARLEAHANLGNA